MMSCRSIEPRVQRRPRRLDGCDDPTGRICCGRPIAIRQPADRLMVAHGVLEALSVSHALLARSRCCAKRHRGGSVPFLRISDHVVKACQRVSNFLGRWIDSPAKSPSFGLTNRKVSSAAKTGWARRPPNVIGTRWDLDSPTLRQSSCGRWRCKGCFAEKNDR
jgi:hypothetical protein